MKKQDNASYNPLSVLSALPDVQCRKTISGSAASPGITMAPAFRLQAGKMKFEEDGHDPKEEAKLFSTALTEAANNWMNCKPTCKAGRQRRPPFCMHKSNCCRMNWS